MGENIITNELLEAGFLVTHLDKGTRGVSANADLMVGHPEIDNPILIQVKSCDCQSLNFIFLGSLSSEKLLDYSKIYNSKPGFKANYVALVGIKSPKEYHYFIVPVEVLAKLAHKHFNAWHSVPKKNGDQRKIVPGMYVVTDIQGARIGHQMMADVDIETIEILEKYKSNATRFYMEGA